MFSKQTTPLVYWFKVTNRKFSIDPHQFCSLEFLSISLTPNSHVLVSSDSSNPASAMRGLMEAILCQFSGFRLKCSGVSRIAVDEGCIYDRIRCMPRNRTDYPEQSSRPSVILPLSVACSACSLVPKFRCAGACCFPNATDRPVLRGHACTNFCVHELPAPSVSSLRETCLCPHVNISSKLSSCPCSLQSLRRLS